jgi:alcohol dehydrogenase
MRGLVLAGPEAIELHTDLAEPVIAAPGDAIIRVELAGLCGSDLHPYLGREPFRPGVIAGHEAIGTVEQVGSGVVRFRPGDRVIVPFTVSCGACTACRQGLSSRCIHSRLFGWGHPDLSLDQALHGGQAERLLVPLADSTLVGLPPGLADGTALLLADNFPTAWHAVAKASPAEGPVVVVGLGPVGLLAVVAARHIGGGRVVGIDPVPERRRLAERLGAVCFPPDEAGAIDRLAAVIEASGSPHGQRTAFSLLAPGGILSVIAVPTTGEFAFTPVEAYDRNLTVVTGRAPVRSILDEVLPLVASGAVVLPTEDIITHPDRPLDEGPDLYRRFAAREGGIVKATFRPVTGPDSPTGVT